MPPAKTGKGSNLLIKHSWFIKQGSALLPLSVYLPIRIKIQFGCEHLMSGLENRRKKRRIIKYSRICFVIPELTSIPEFPVVKNSP